jgi:ATP-binding cassette, subfamily F, member 3
VKFLEENVEKLGVVNRAFLGGPAEPDERFAWVVQKAGARRYPWPTRAGLRGHEEIAPVMPLLACANIRYAIGTRILLDGLAMSVDAGERIGLVGRNGCGKTTLMRILSGRLKPDSGTVSVARSTRIGYLTQDPELDPDATLRHEASAGFVELTKVHDELDEVFRLMEMPENAEPVALDRLMKRQSELQERIDAMGGYAVDHKIDQVLHGLGFTDAQFSVPVRSLSGGQKGRLALAKLLLESPDLLLLDEPTNHLDIAGCEWLENFLNDEFKGAVLMISHDRRMLDNVVHRIEEVEQGRLIEYPGNYTAFTEIRAQRLLTQSRAYENQQSQWAKEEEYIRRFKAGQRAKEAQGRLSKLERQKELFALDRPTEVGVMKFRLPVATRSGDQVIVCREASKWYANDGATKLLFKNLTLTISRGERWAVIGPNGAGKTTLVKAMLGETGLSEGTTKLGASVVIGYYQQLPPETDGDIRVFEYLQQIIKRENPGTMWSEQQARDLAGAFLFSGPDQDKQIGLMSGGERSRARLAGLLASAKNLIILDEPTNHLDIPSCERLEDTLRIEKDELGNRLEDQDEDKFQGTVILISHDRALIDAVCDHLVVLDGEGNAEVFVGTYQQYLLAKKEEAKKAAARAAAKPAPAKPAPTKPAAGKSEGKTEGKTEGKAEGKSDNKPANDAPIKPAAKAVSNGPAPKPSTPPASSRAPEPGPKKPAGKSKFSWMPMDRLEKEIEGKTKALKQADEALSDPDVYANADRAKKALADRDAIAGELTEMEEEWMRR